MRQSNALRYLPAFFLIVAITLSGCASFAPVQTREMKPSLTEEISSTHGWWQARFRMKWPEDSTPSWWVDIFIAHQIISPILDQYKSELLLWRFHRRAARDKAGHQFSFIFYASAQTAQQIFQALELDPLLEKMKSAGVIIQTPNDNPNRVNKPNIQDTSDKNWSMPIKKSWPYYIMGVSQMWLNLIKEVAYPESDGKRLSTVDEIKTFYRQASESVTAYWKMEGGHAYFHHLSAIFGYESVYINERRLQKF